METVAPLQSSVECTEQDNELSDETVQSTANQYEKMTPEAVFISSEECEDDKDQEKEDAYANKRTKYFDGQSLKDNYDEDLEMIYIITDIDTSKVPVSDNCITLSAEIGKVNPCRFLQSPHQKTLMLNMRKIRHHSVPNAIDYAKKLIDQNILKFTKSGLDRILVALQSLVPSMPEGIEVLEKGVKMCLDPSCENPTVLECRLHYKLILCHYLAENFEEMEKHAIAAFKSGNEICGDSGPILAHRYYAQAKQRAVKLPITSSQNVDEIGFHYSKALDRINNEPLTWQTEFVEVAENYAVWKMIEANSFKERGLECNMEFCLSEGKNLLDKLDRMNEFETVKFGELDVAFVECAKSLQHKAQGNHSSARQFKNQAITRLEQCGRWTDVNYMAEIFSTFNIS